MEVDEIRTQNLKRSRIGEMGRKLEDLHQEDDEDDGGVGENRLRSWHSSRIFRVSRTSGGKDRHSKVLTSKGLRDRRVRLSVSTAIQFYDLQDRLGYDQPSKAVEWLINAASDAIAELPPLNTTFQNPNFCQENEAANYLQKPISLRKSTSSSPSEASKGSVLSLSQPEMPLKTRTQERTGKEEEKESLNLDSQGSFTELLIIGTNENKKPLSDSGVHSIIPGVSSTTQFGNPMHSFISPLGVAGSGDQSELHRYSFIPDQLIPSNNFSVSSSISGFNRGTLQSNSSSPLLHCQKLPTSLDGPHFPFFLGTASNVPGFMVENQFPLGFDGRLQLYFLPKMAALGGGVWIGTRDIESSVALRNGPSGLEPTKLSMKAQLH